MATTRRAWVGSSIVAGAVVSLWVIHAHLSTFARPTEAEFLAPTPLQIELQVLDTELVRWIDERDPVAKSSCLESIDALFRVAAQTGGDPSAQPTTGLLPMIASLKSGLHALTIQDRLILLAEQEVRRAQTPASVDRLFRANERREEIIIMMITPALDLLETKLGFSPTTDPSSVREVKQVAST